MCKKNLINLFIVLFLSFLFTFFIYIIFLPIFKSNSIIIPYFLKPFNIVSKYPVLWKNLKITYIVLTFFSFLLLFNSFVYILQNFKKKSFSSISTSSNSSDLKLYLGKNQNQEFFINNQALFQNILITGTTGSGKTSAAMYPFVEQLIKFNSKAKIGMLILDVKGNFYKTVKNICLKYNRLDDLRIIEIGKKIKYNPLDKPYLKASVLANRLKTILTLFSPNNTESYWLDKVETILTEAIKLCRLYNNNYVTFLEIHKLIINKNYYIEKISLIKTLFEEGKLNHSAKYNLLASLEFFENEFFSLDERTFSILKSEITRITSLFVNDYDIQNTFCPEKKDISFNGFKNVINNGLIVVLNMNIFKYQNLSKIIAAYLKLDFQTEVMNQLTYKKNTNINVSAFISDEFHEYVTSTDADFFAQSREAKCINIVATQSYTSLKNTLKNNDTTFVLIQNLVNKLWFRTDDIFTIENVQKQLGKEDKIKYSTIISENAKETTFNFLLNTFKSLNSNLSESINSYTQTDFIYDFNFFTQKLETFSCLCFISNGTSIFPPMKLNLIPYFKNFK